MVSKSLECNMYFKLSMKASDGNWCSIAEPARARQPWGQRRCRLILGSGAGDDGPAQGIGTPGQRIRRAQRWRLEGSSDTTCSIRAGAPRWPSGGHGTAHPQASRACVSGRLPLGRGCHASPIKGAWGKYRRRGSNPRPQD